MTYYKRTPQSPEQFLHWKVKDLERRVSNIEGGKVLSAPLYDWNNLPQDSVEGQVAILDNIPSAYGKAVLPRNVTELDQVRGATTLGTSYVLNWRWNEINIGDGILVMAWAPSKYQVGAALGTPTTVTDSKGNTYTPLVQRKFEDATR